MTTIIEVIDTAVKIGLGAVIAGVFSLLGTRFSSEREKKIHRRKKLEEAVSYLNKSQSYQSTMCASLMRLKGTTDEKAKNECANEFEALVEGLDESAIDHNAASSIFLMCGLEDIASDIFDASEKFSKKIFQIEEMEGEEALESARNLSRRMIERRKNIFQKIANAYGLKEVEK